VRGTGVSEEGKSIVKIDLKGHYFDTQKNGEGQGEPEVVQSTREKLFWRRGKSHSPGTKVGFFRYNCCGWVQILN